MEFIFIFSKIKNMKTLLKLLITALAVVISAWILPGVEFPALQESWSFKAMMGPILFAVVITLLNTFVKPVLKILSFPITLFTFGLFLLVINALMILLADWLLDSLVVNGFWWAFIFAIVLSMVEWLLEKILGSDDDDETN